MNIFKTAIKDLLVIEPKVFGDERGYFFESYNKTLWSTNGIAIDFVQDNEAKSKKGVLRGLHYQLPPYAQSKLVRVVKGKVLDVAVDIREGSETYGQYYSIELSAENKKQLFVPKGFAHGYITLSQEAIFCYKCDAVYNKEAERGIKFDSKELNIDWLLDPREYILSQKDKLQVDFGSHDKFFV